MSQLAYSRNQAKNNRGRPNEIWDGGPKGSQESAARDACSDGSGCTYLRQSHPSGNGNDLHGKCEFEGCPSAKHAEMEAGRQVDNRDVDGRIPIDCPSGVLPGDSISRIRCRTGVFRSEGAVGGGGFDGELSSGLAGKKKPRGANLVAFLFHGLKRPPRLCSRRYWTKPKLVSGPGPEFSGNVPN